MNAAEYCAEVERRDLFQKEQCRTKLVVEDNAPLISLKDAGFDLRFEPAIEKDYRYLVREPILEKIGRICRRLGSQDKALIVRSAWRSFSHQRKLWQRRVDLLQKEYPEVHPKQIEEMAEYFIAPAEKSMHATGGSVDALIYDERNDCVMDFGTNKNLKIALGRECYPYHPDITPQARTNRDLLIGLFEDEGFVVDIKEFWHFDYGNVLWAIAKSEPHAIYGAIQAA